MEGDSKVSYLEKTYGIKPVVKSYCNMISMSPPDPFAVKALRIIKKSIKDLNNLYMEYPGCEKSYRLVFGLDYDISFALTHFEREGPKDGNSFPTKEDLSTWFSYEGRAHELLLLTPNLARLRKPAGALAWTEEQTDLFEKSKNALLKNWSALRERYRSCYEGTDLWSKEVKETCKKSLNLQCYVNGNK